MSNNRLKSPTQVASNEHPGGCTCGCLNTFPKVVYRDFRGSEPTFTGILQVDGTFQCMWKLNDPNYLGFNDGDTLKDLAGTGHIMTQAELLLELKQYNLDPKERSPERSLRVPSRRIATCPPAQLLRR